MVNTYKNNKQENVTAKGKRKNKTKKQQQPAK